MLKKKKIQVAVLPPFENDGRKYGDDGKAIVPKKELPKWLPYVVGALGGGLLAVIIFSIVGWFKINTIVFHSPIEVKFFAPIRFVNREIYKKETEVSKQIVEFEQMAIEKAKHPEELPKCNAEVMKSIDPDKFYDFIWNAESTRGKNKPKNSLAYYCEQKGEINEIGYAPSIKFCFKSKAEQDAFVPYYVLRNCKGFTMDECLCYYNEGNEKDENGKSLGRPASSCYYSRGELSKAN